MEEISAMVQGHDDHDEAAGDIDGRDAFHPGNAFA
jgi:hypothetical protein